MAELLCNNAPTKTHNIRAINFLPLDLIFADYILYLLFNYTIWILNIIILWIFLWDFNIYHFILQLNTLPWYIKLYFSFNCQIAKPTITYITAIQTVESYFINFIYYFYLMSYCFKTKILKNWLSYKNQNHQ